MELVKIKMVSFKSFKRLMKLGCGFLFLAAWQILTEFFELLL